jgi:2-C-methyl-D-erythritol 4-phosphate cytidylyltransferase
VSVWAVLAAAGRGERLDADRPKAFAPLGGRPLLAESLERLETCSWIDSIVVVAPPGWEEPVILLAEELGCGKVVASVAGGEARAESVRIGVGEVDAGAAVVVVHDAARPLVSDAVIERLLGALNDGWDGAVPGLPVVDTVKRVENGAVVETLRRAELVTVQTPQAFVADVLRNAMSGGADATDCSALVEAAGGRVALVSGDPRLLKVTTADDLALIESWLAR